GRRAGWPGREARRSRCSARPGEGGRPGAGIGTAGKAGAITGGRRRAGRRPRPPPACRGAPGVAAGGPALRHAPGAGPRHAPCSDRPLAGRQVDARPAECASARWRRPPSSWRCAMLGGGAGRLAHEGARSHSVSRIVFVEMPAFGHVNPSLPLVRELVRRGERVVYYVDAEFDHAVAASGAAFRAYPPGVVTSAHIAQATQTGDLVRVPRLILRATDSLVPFLLDRLPGVQPAAIVLDSNALWG